MTIINHTYGFIFIHVPKNAGTSVTTYLSQLSTYRDQEIGGSEFGQQVAPFYRDRFGIAKHSTAKEIASIVGSETWQRYRTFAIKRDPIDRLVSIFAFLQRWKRWRELEGFRRYVGEFERCRSVEEFVHTDFFRKTVGPDRLFREQSLWLLDTDGQLLVDNVIEVERLEEALPTLLRSVGVPPEKLSGPVGELNVSARKGVGAISEAAALELRERYRQDYRLLGYSPAS